MWSFRKNPARSVRSFEVYNPRSGQSLGRYRASSAQHAIAAAIRDAGYRAHVSTRTGKVVSNAPGMGSLSARAATRSNPARTMGLYRVRQHHFRASSAVHAKAAYLRELGYSARVDGRKLVTNAPRSAFVGVEAYRQTRANPAKRRTYR